MLASCLFQWRTKLVCKNLFITPSIYEVLLRTKYVCCSSGSPGVRGKSTQRRQRRDIKQRLLLQYLDQHQSSRIWKVSRQLFAVCVASSMIMTLPICISGKPCPGSVHQAPVRDIVMILMVHTPHSHHCYRYSKNILLRICLLAINVQRTESYFSILNPYLKTQR